MAGKRSIPLGIELVKRGLINEADITTALADMRVSILQINVTPRADSAYVINMKVGCRNIDHYNSIVSRLRGLHGVDNILRGFS